MRFLAPTRRFGRKVAATFSDVSTLKVDQTSSPLLKTVGWVSAGVGALAIGLVVGRELRQRYKFNRRTPYDFYAHSGDQRDIEMDFGLGI